MDEGEPDRELAPLANGGYSHPRVSAESLSAVKYFVLSCSFVLVSSLLASVFLVAFLHVPFPRQQETVEIKVERGEPVSSIVRKLKEKQVISNERLFILSARLLLVEKKIHWGRYFFEPPLSPREMLDRMILGRGVFRRITIPEGLTVREIAELLDGAGIARKEQVLAEATRPELLSRLGLEGKGIEGYLFPDTYYFTPHTTEREILVAMADQFRVNLNPWMLEKTSELGFSLYEVVTLASLIEKETGSDAERPLISAVFHNRLKRNIPLQSDPTVIYGLKRYSGQLTRRDLQSPSRYNTYRFRGFPPTPICNPGLASLRAAVNPANVPYLYFVSKNDGSHLFSATLEEHNLAVEKYQMKNRDPSRS